MNNKKMITLKKTEEILTNLEEQGLIEFKKNSYILTSKGKLKVHKFMKYNLEMCVLYTICELEAFGRNE